MKTIYLAAAMASALSLSTPASAEFFNFTMAPLLGVSAGQASFDVSCPAASSCDDTDTAWRVFGGLEVNEYISMEVGYADLGKAEISGATSGTAEANEAVKERMSKAASRCCMSHPPAITLR